MTIKSKLNNIFSKGKNIISKIPLMYGILILSVIIIIILSAIFLVYYRDNEKPSLEVITKNITVNEGDIATIQVNFSDNDKIDIAKLYYKKESDTTFLSMSIINRSANILIPTGSGEDWEYYVVVDDPAKNGPIGDPSIDGNTTYKINVLELYNNDNDSDDTEYQRYIFIEECSSKNCHNCPDVAQKLHELHALEKYNFHYVTLVSQHDKANERMQDYNVEGYPIVFIDGGYEVVYGNKEKGDFENAIQNAISRQTPNIKINLTTEFDQIDEQININIKISNEENTQYTGRLKVYLAEIISTQYQDFQGNPYNNSFIEFAIDKDISINANSEITETKTLDGNTYDPENLLIYTVVFSKDKHLNYHDDTDEESNRFDAYYVDACSGMQVVKGGNLPPIIGISYPKNGKVYVMGRQIQLLHSFTFERTVLLGRCNFTIDASERDNDYIERVEVYIDNTLIQTITSAPYTYNYKNPSLLPFKHTITFTAYDSYGKDASASIDVFAITLKQKT